MAGPKVERSRHNSTAWLAVGAALGTKSRAGKKGLDTHYCTQPQGGRPKGRHCCYGWRRRPEILLVHADTPRSRRHRCLYPCDAPQGGRGHARRPGPSLFFFAAERRVRAAAPVWVPSEKGRRRRGGRKRFRFTWLSPAQQPTQEPRTTRRNHTSRRNSVLSIPASRQCQLPSRHPSSTPDAVHDHPLCPSVEAPSFVPRPPLLSILNQLETTGRPPPPPRHCSCFSRLAGTGETPDRPLATPAGTTAGAAAGAAGAAASTPRASTAT